MANAEMENFPVNVGNSIPVVERCMEMLGATTKYLETMLFISIQTLQLEFR